MPKKRGRKNQTFNKQKMKKLLFGLLAIGFVSLSSFTTKDSKEVVSKYCTYHMYGTQGQYLGTYTIEVLATWSCGSSIAKSLAVDLWNIDHGIYN